MKNAVALGTFDGVHIGHLRVLDIPDGYRKIVVTFDNPPKALSQDYLGLLMTTEDKFEFLKSLGVDEIYSMDFIAVKDIEPQRFLEIIKKKYNPSIISCGYNYRFGKNGKGDINLLKEFCEKNQIVLNCVDKVTVDNSEVSSTFIRDYISKGNINLANKLLGKNFGFSAEVIHGDKRGRTFGFPTINQKYPTSLVKARFGVYKSVIKIGKEQYLGITNIGKRPTFLSDYVISETYIKDFKGDLYGKEIRVELIDFLRDEIKFNSIEELKGQIKKDIKEIEKR